MKLSPLLLSLSLTLAASADPWSDSFTFEKIAIPAGIDPQIGGLATLPDQRLVVAFHRGQVMIYDPAKKTWSKFAEGLHEPLGLLVEDDNNILVMQRPELTRLTDTDGDGVADEYTTVFDDFGMTGNYHEFAFGPAKDEDGNLYISLGVASSGAGIREEIRGTFQPIGISRERMLQNKNWKKNQKAAGRMYSRAPWRGWIMKISPAGVGTPYAAGVRSPNGIAFDKDGRLLVLDNQGDWLGTSKVHHIQKDGFHGHPAALVWKDGWTRNPLEVPVEELDQMRIRAAGLIPQSELANSPTQPIVIPEGIFGALAGQTIIGEMNQPTLVRYLPDSGVSSASQGTTLPFLQNSPLGMGNNRLTFTSDGSLWVGKTHLSWPGSEGLVRIKQKDPKTPLFAIEAVNFTGDGFTMKFTDTLAPQPIKLNRHTYNYQVKYGSKKIDEASIALNEGDVTAIDDKTWKIKVSDLKEDYLYTFDLKDLKSKSGKPILGDKAYYHLISAKK